MDAATPPQRAATPPQGVPGCGGTTRAGAPCRGILVAGSAYCLAHDPQRRAQAAAGRSKGAAASNKLRALRGRRQKLDSPAALVGFTGGLIQDVLAGTLPHEIARVALYGVSIQRQLLEASDLEARLSALEAKQDATTPRKGQRPWVT